MKIVIIEDERLTAKDLEDTLHQYDSSIVVAAKLLSVKDAIRYFEDNEAPDLVFSDIQLGDGLSFEIFKVTKLNTPVIFCTAFDEYALNAFQANGIDYLLKPFTLATVSAALDKFKRLTQSSSNNKEQLELITKLFDSRNSEAVTSILVPYKDKIIPVKLKEVAVFFLENEIVHLITFSQKEYFPGKNLEELEKISGKNFYRANRQYLVNREAVTDVSNQLGRKLWVNLSVPVKDSVTVSKEKMIHFLQWLSGD